MTRHIRRPPTIDETERLRALLKEVPTETTVRFKWTNPSGLAFIRAMRDLQVDGVPLPWIAEELGVSSIALEGAVSNHERKPPSRKNRGR